MKLGFLTACMPQLALDRIATWASEHGYAALEVAAWPRTGDRASSASHLDTRDLTPADVEATLHLFDRFRLELSSIAYYDNNLHPEPTARRTVHDHLRACIDAAALLGCPTVGTFIGRDNGKTVTENLRQAEKVFPPLVDYAGERGVRIIVENCPMQSWHPDGYPANLAYSPELWEWMFDLGLYLNFDPSHLVWLGIDPVEAIRPYLNRVPHAQAKDTQVDPVQRNRYGIFGKATDRGNQSNRGWWRYRVPGLGDVDWRRLVDALHEGGFDGVLSIEHEDPEWEGTEENVKTGLEIARRTLRPLIVT